MTRILLTRLLTVVLAVLCTSSPTSAQDVADPSKDERTARSDRRSAQELVEQSPHAQPYVFSGAQFPKFAFQSEAEIERLIGPYKISATFYNADHEPVTEPAEPGRYGAVVEIEPEQGPTLRRFVTLFRMPQEVEWWRADLNVSLTLPEGLGINPDVADASDELSGYVADRFHDSLWREHNSAVVLAGLYERGDNAREYDFFESVWVADRQWWLDLKRKLYGWDKRWPDPVVAPRPIEGKLAPELRRGTPAEAGIKPELVEHLDAMFRQWADNSDEAFAVCFARHGVIFMHEAYGMRDGEPMTVNTKSWMASFTKMMSGTLWGMLLDEGVARLDDRADQYLPPLTGVTTNRPLTIRRLYNHTAGFEGHWGDEMNDLEERIVSLLPHLEVGQRYAYNGTDMALACKILEGISGECLPLFYRNHLFGPLECEHIEVSDASAGARAAPLDIAKICQLHLNRGAYGKWRFFSEELAGQMLPRAIAPQVVERKTADSSGGPVHYGVGTQYFAITALTEFAFGHGAASGSIMRIDPVYDLVIVMTRNDRGRNFDEYCPKFIDMIVAGLVDRPQLPDITGALSAADTDLDSASGRLDVTRVLANNGEKPMTFEFDLDTTNTSWRADTPHGRLVLPAGGEGRIRMALTFDPARPLPTPQLLGNLRYGDLPPLEKVIDLRPRIRRTTEAARVATSPTVDGVMSDGEYGDAPPATELLPMAGHDLGGKGTRFWLAYNNTHLFLAAIADEDNATSIETPLRDRDGEVWRDDSIELFVDATHDRATYHQFLMNLRGQQFDAIGGPQRGQWGDTKWDASWRCAATAHDDAYVIEMAIPFEALGVASPKPGDVWGINVGRTRSAQAGKTSTPQSAAWAVTYVNFHQVTHFGDVMFQ